MVQSGKHSSRYGVESTGVGTERKVQLKVQSGEYRGRIEQMQVQSDKEVGKVQWMTVDDS